VYSLVRAPTVGWGSAQTIGMLAGSAILAAAFAVNEQRSRNPLVPSAVLRVKGLVAADMTQLIAFAGFLSMFFFVTLYMQEVLHYSPLKAGAAYLPTTAGFVVAGGIASQLITRIGSRPVVVVGSLIAAAGIYYLSRLPLHGSYVTDLLPGFLVMSLGADRYSSRSPPPPTPASPGTRRAWRRDCSTPPSRSAAPSAWPSCPSWRSRAPAT